VLKNAYFLGKSCKNRLSAGAPPQSPACLRRLGALPVTSSYYYNFVEFVSSDKRILFRSSDKCVLSVSDSQKEPSNGSKCCAFASSTLLHLYFNSNSVSFVEGGRKNISCPRVQDTLATPLLVGPQLTKFISYPNISDMTSKRKVFQTAKFWTPLTFLKLSTRSGSQLSSIKFWL